MSKLEHSSASSQEAIREKERLVEQAFQNPDNLVIPVDLDQEMRKSFIDYAMSVITDRALPDVRDGLKPVHRRILYSMFTQGFTSDKPFRKCATTVGDVLGRFHPHGDASVYDALVRLAQDFSMRHRLVDGHGNFGSRDGDPPAAYRYTEARLTSLSEEMMGDINKETVDFRPNFDEHVMEPSVLPAAIPNLLVNGTSGIAVGMATNIPPHNLGETIDAVIYLMENPEATAEDLMAVLPGPDFPTAGAIIGSAGIRQMYRTGRGRIICRAHAEIEDSKNNRYRIIVRDLPYMVNKARLIERIAALVKEGRIEGISDLRDESDRSESVRIVIELKRDATPEVVLNQLYHHTQMQDVFSANLLALVPHETGALVPQILNLTAALSHYINHRRSVTTRRVQFDLKKAEERKHIVEGLLLAIDDIDRVINVIRASANEPAAQLALQETFGLTEKQAKHVVDMRLGRLSGLERDKLQTEQRDLVQKIAEFYSILQDPLKLDQVVKEQLLAMKAKYANPRRTAIEPDMGDIDDESLIEEEDVVITLSHEGYVKRIPVETYSAQRRGGKGITGMQTREEDYVQQIFTTSTHSLLLAFSTRGRVYALKGYRVPEAGRQARGTAFVNLLPLGTDEKIKTLVAVKKEDLSGDQFLLMATKKGVIKKTPCVDYANINRAGLIAINLREDDELIDVLVAQPGQQVMLVTQRGKGIRFDSDSVRATGRNTMGVKGIDIDGQDSVIGMIVSDENAPVLFVTQNGYGKRTEVGQFRLQHRGGKGLIAYRASEKTGDLVRVILAGDQEDILLINDIGVIIRIHASEVPVLARATRGVTLMRSHKGTVVDVAVVDREEESEDLESLEGVESLDSEDEDLEMELENMDLEEETNSEAMEESEPEETSSTEETERE